MYKELKYEPIKRFMYYTCKCGNTISLDYENQFDKCPFCDRNLIENEDVIKG